MTSVKKISHKTKSKSNKIDHTVSLNYFRKKRYKGWAPTKTQFILLRINSYKFHYFGVRKTYSFKKKNENGSFEN